MSITARQHDSLLPSLCWINPGVVVGFGDDWWVQGRSVIGTLVERQTRNVKLIHLPRPDSFEMRDGLRRALAGLPA
jgi:hypothetical protein